MYSSEDLEIKCKSNTMKLASFVEMQPLLYKDFSFSTRLRRCLMENRYRAELLCQDIQLMSYCKHAIITLSSFGWWGAYFIKNPNKITISPILTIDTTYHC